MSKVGSIILFAFGATLGFVGGAYWSKKKYEKITEDEVKSLRETYSAERRAERSDPKEDENSDNSEPADDTKDAEKVVAEKSSISGTTLSKPAPKGPIHDYTRDYRSEAAKEEPEEVKHAPVLTEPYFITADEFDSIPAYVSMYLNLQVNGILTGDDDDEVDDAMGLVGTLIEQRTEKDLVLYIRNPRLACDIEVVIEQPKNAISEQPKPGEIGYPPQARSPRLRKPHEVEGDEE